MDIKNNLSEVHKKISSACLRANRSVDDVTLICVSKTKPVEMLIEAYAQNERCFGENKVQEIVEKYDKLPPEAKFHMIGHLQTNKIKQLLGKCTLIHSVDSLYLAKAIDKEAKKKNITVDILIEVNAANEATKYGVSFEQVPGLVIEISKLSNLCIRGLMTVAPYVENGEDNRPIFKKMYQLFVDLKCKNIDNTNIDILSMGMTGDYEVAIEEGATMVRIGTGIFGARNYNI